MSETWGVETMKVNPFDPRAVTQTTDVFSRFRHFHQSGREIPRNSLETEPIQGIMIGIGDAIWSYFSQQLDHPQTSLAAQMHGSCVAASQILHCVPDEHAGIEGLECDDAWNLSRMITFVCNIDFDIGSEYWTQKITVEFSDGRPSASETVRVPKRLTGYVLSNDETLQKWRKITEDVMDMHQRDRIEGLVLGLERWRNWVN